MKSARIHPVARPLVALCHRLAALGFAPGLSGQVLVRDEDLLWVTPEGIGLAHVQPEDLIVLWPDGRLLAEADRVPPSGFERWQALFQHTSSLRAVIISQPPQLMAWAYRQLAGQAQAGKPGEHLPQDLPLPPGAQSGLRKEPERLQLLPQTQPGECLSSQLEPMGGGLFLDRQAGRMISADVDLLAALNRLEAAEAGAHIALLAQGADPSV